MKKYKISVAIIMLGTLLSKVLGLAREVILAQKYGTGYISDAFIISLNIPSILITSFAGAILTNYIPLFSKAERESEEKAKRFNGNILSICLIISIAIIIIFIPFAKPISKIFAVGFDDVGLTYLVNLSRITIFSMYFILSANIFKGYLEYKGKFLGTSIYGILMNVGMILGIVFSSTEKYIILGYGILAGYALSLLVLIILAKKNKFKSKANINLKDQYLKQMVILTLPMLLNDAIWEINGIVDKSIVSTIGTGYISAVNYSNYIVNMISSVFATSIVTVFFPNIVRTFNEQGIERVKEKTCTILKTIIFITIPCTILIMLFSRTIVKVLFFRGAFNEESLNITSIAVTVYSLALTFICLKIILFKVFYAMQDTKTPTKAAVISILINIVLSLVLVKPLGYLGIITATVISSVASTFLLIKMFNKRHEKLLDKQLWINILKIGLAAIFMLIIILVINSFTAHLFIVNELISEILKATIGCIGGIIGYLIMLILMKFNFKLKEDLSLD